MKISNLSILVFNFDIQNVLCLGSVSLAGTEGGLWSVEGGNYKIPECLLQKSGASHIRGLVHGVEQLQIFNSTSYSISFGEGRETEEYDIVVVAAPQTRLDEN